MRTTHTLIQGDARDLSFIPSSSVQLVVTSPPYPMIEMWDALFSEISPTVRDALNDGDGNRAFEAMHRELDGVWAEMYRVLSEGCFACINIGDATRSIGGNFQLYSNHSRITEACRRIGFDALPVILWRKTTNAPNKFMGSGMLPAGAYVTLEHEYILIFRKGGKRVFASAEEKQFRNSSAFFWEERNRWFSDLWDLKGVSQPLCLPDGRERSAAYPFELAYRLIHMYSVFGDTVIDPFLGTGTTTAAAVGGCRNSIGVEIDPVLKPRIIRSTLGCKDFVNRRLCERVEDHLQFVQERLVTRGDMKHRSRSYGFPVMTKQETEIVLFAVNAIEEVQAGSVFQVDHSPLQNVPPLPQ